MLMEYLSMLLFIVFQHELLQNIINTIYFIWTSQNTTLFYYINFCLF